ncbi:MAG: hypothetical protein N3F67_03430 [Acidilobaceae archaeon]|nr:hypothetical protein [Acidilobaceae archaeon]
MRGELLLRALERCKGIKEAPGKAVRKEPAHEQSDGEGGKGSKVPPEAL